MGLNNIAGMVNLFTATATAPAPPDVDNFGLTANNYCYVFQTAFFGLRHGETLEGWF
jgi:hypothetical protein